MELSFYIHIRHSFPQYFERQSYHTIVNKDSDSDRIRLNWSFFSILNLLTSNNVDDNLITFVINHLD